MIHQRPNTDSFVQRGTSALATNKVLRNTYMLLSMTLIFSAGVAYLSMIMNAPFPGLILFFVGSIGLSFLTHALRNSAWGILSVFLFTGFLGYTLGPILNMYLINFVNGGQMISTALFGTGLIFFSMSAYVLSTGKELQNLGKFILIGSIVAIVAMVGAIFTQMTMLSLVASSAFIILSSAMIAYQTSAIIHGGETNYISATVTLYGSIYNLFVSLLNILAILNGQD
jgi:modulator of FtsH protease